MRKKVLTCVAFVLSVAAFAFGWATLAHEGEHHSPGGNGQPDNAALAAMAFTPCVNGMAGTFPCHNVDLASFLPLADISAAAANDTTLPQDRVANDVWGWTDQQTGKEYAILG